MDKGNHPIAVFYLYSVGIHGSICRCEIYIYTDWRRRKSGADIICYLLWCVYILLFSEDSFVDLPVHLEVLAME